MTKLDMMQVYEWPLKHIVQPLSQAYLTLYKSEDYRLPSNMSQNWHCHQV